MKSAIAITLVIATLAQARPVALYESLRPDTGAYTVVNADKYASLESLAQGRLGAVNRGDRTYVLTEQVEQTVTNELDEVEVVVSTVDVPVSRCVWFPGDEMPSIATQAQLDADAAAVAAAAQAAQVAALQAIVDNPEAKAAIMELEAHIDYFAIERPPTLAKAKTKVKEWKADKKSQAKLQDQLDGSFNALNMTLLFQGLGAKGIDEATINAVYSYMVATGQDQ